MPFDYNSFLQGVQTGLRLGRTSPGRVPPMPPVPAGNYILMEDGTLTIAEKKPYEGATILWPGEYDAILYNTDRIDSTIQDEGTMTVFFPEGRDMPPLKAFFVCNTSGTYKDYVKCCVFCDVSDYPPITQTYWYNYSFVGETWRKEGTYTLASPPTETYGVYATIWIGQFPRPVGAEIFFGSDDEAIYWAANSPNIPLITEGG